MFRMTPEDAPSGLVLVGILAGAFAGSLSEIRATSYKYPGSMVSLSACATPPHSEESAHDKATVGQFRNYEIARLLRALAVSAHFCYNQQQYRKGETRHTTRHTV